MTALDIYANVGERIKKAVEVAAIEALRGSLPEPRTPISMTGAALKYNVSPGAIKNWVKKQWVSVLDPGKGRSGSRVLIDERDVAYIVFTNDISQGHKTKGPNGHSYLQIAREFLEEADAPGNGIPISVHQAARKYGVSRQTIYDWAKKGRIATIAAGKGQEGSRVLVDERAVASIVRTEGVGKAKKTRDAV